MPVTFVIPIVNPSVGRFQDYLEVERILKATIDSLGSQSHDEISIVVVAHRVPEWHEGNNSKLYFLIIEDDSGLPTAHGLRHVDQGVKRLIGSTFAVKHLGARHIVVMDGDDFARNDLAETASLGMPVKPGRDGWIVSKGYHVDLSLSAEKMEINGVYEVRGFNETCGSCRIFLPGAILRFIEENTPEFGSAIRFLEGDRAFFVSRNGLAALLRDIEPAFRSRKHHIWRFGSHTHQDACFDFAKLEIPFMAKGCGHGNHAGQAAGAVHWHRVRRRLDRREFVEKFGLSGVENVEIAGGGLSAIEVQSRVLTATARLAGQKIRKKLGG